MRWPICGSVVSSRGFRRPILNSQTNTTTEQTKGLGRNGTREQLSSELAGPLARGGQIARMSGPPQPTPTDLCDTPVRASQTLVLPESLPHLAGTLAKGAR